MIKRLEQGLSVDWSKFHAIHSAVKPSAPRQTTKPVAKYADGVVSVPGPKGAGDIVPAMLSPGEAVIPAKKAKKYAPLINAMIAGNIPGYELGLEAEGRSSSLRTYTEFTALLSKASNSALNTGTAIPSGIAQEFTLNPEAIQGPLIAYLAEQLSGATTQVQIRKALEQDPSIEQYARDLSLNIAKEVSSITADAMGDPDLYSSVKKAIAATPASKNISAAVGSIAANQTTFEDDTVERVRSSGRFQAMGRERLTADRGRYTTIADRGRELSNQRYGSVLTNPVAAHLTAPQDTPLSSISSMTNLSPQAQTAVGRKQRGEKEIRTDGRSVVVPANATPEQKRLAVEAGKNIVDNIGQEVVNAAQVNSPSKKTKLAAQGMVDGVVETIKSGKAAVTQATGASFLKPVSEVAQAAPGFMPRKIAPATNTQAANQAAVAAGEMSMSPLRAYFTVVGANLREVIQDFKSEVGIVSKDSMGPLEAYLTTVRANLRDVWTDSKAEFAGIFNGPGIAEAGQTAAQRFRQGIEQANPQLVIDGKQMGLDYAAAAKGQHGGIAAVLTKKNAELISSATSAWNNGIREIPKQGQSMFKIAGGMVSEEIASSIIDRTRQLSPLVADAVSGSSNARRVGSGPMGTASYDMLDGEKMPHRGASKISDRSAIEATYKTFGERLGSLNTKMMAFSGTFSSLGMMAAMAGDSLGGMGQTIYEMSNGFFLLSGIIQMLNVEKIKELGLLKAQNLADFFSTLKTSGLRAFVNIKKAGMVTGKVFSGGFVKSIGNVGKLFGGLGKTIMGLGGGLGRLIPIVGAAFTAFQVIKFISDVQKEQESKIRGMGDAAFLAGEKLAAIASLLPDYEPETDPGTIGSAVVSKESGMSAAAQAAEKDVDGEALTAAIGEGGELQDMANAIKSATATQLKTLLTSLANEMIALDPDIDPASVQGLLSRIAKEVGQSDIQFGDMLIPDPNDATFKSRLNDTVSQIAADAEELRQKYLSADAEAARNLDPNAGPQEAINVSNQVAGAFEGDASAIASRAASAMETLKASLRLGVIQQDEFTSSIGETLNGIVALGPTLGGEAANSLMRTLGFQESTISELETIEGKINAIKFASVADMSGDQIDVSLLKAVDAGNRIGATARQMGTATKALRQLEQQYGATTEAAFRSGDEQLQQAEDAEQYFTDQTSANEKLLEDARNIVAANNEIAASAADANIPYLSLSDAMDMLKDEKFAAAFAEAGGDPEKIKDVVAQWNDYKASLDAVDKALALDSVETAIKDLKEDAATKDALMRAGYSAAEATDILSNSLWAQAFAADLSEEAIEDLKVKYEEWKSLADAGTEPGGPGGTREQTPFEKAIEQLQDQRKELLNNKKAYAGLRDEGFSVAEAFDAASDSTLAAALASEKIGSAKWEKLVKLAKDYNKELLKMDIAELTRRNNIEIETINNTFKLREGLEEAGYSAETIERAIEQIGDNPEILAALAKDLEDGKVNAKNMVDLLKSIDGIEVAIKLTKTPQQLREDALEAIGVLNNYFNAQEQAIRNAFRTGSEVAMDLDNDAKTVDVKVNTGKINIAQLEKDIAEAEEYIASRQFQIDDYQYGLDAIAKQEEGINKKYDKRIEALDKVASLNSKISEGQKSQLDVATALASGDVAAAARAMQEDEARRAQEAVEQQKESIESAREKEVAALSATVNGTKLTRVQLEEKISTLQDEIAKKEEDTLEPKQRALDLANKQIEALVSSITYAGKNRDAWVEIEGKIALANIELGKYMDMLKKIADGTFKFGDEKFTGPTNTVAAPTPKSLTGSTTYGNLELRAKDPKAFAEARAKEEEALLKRDDIGPKARAAAEKRLESYNQVVKNASAGGQILKKQMGGSIKRYALGGNVSGFKKGRYSMGTDIVPAMLTPGEFVVRKYAVDKFGVDNLKAINRGEYKSGSVYNYSVNVNVSTDADPDRIARAVMTEIKRSESQRIRRF
jgi:hypothetical protein